jgi:hypothetical protein
LLLAGSRVVLSTLLLAVQVVGSLLAAHLATFRHHVDAYVGSGNSIYVLVGSFVIVGGIAAERLR